MNIEQMELQVLNEVYANAVRVTSTAKSTGSVDHAQILLLETAVDNAKHFFKVRNDSERAYRASMYQNVGM